MHLPSSSLIPGLAGSNNEDNAELFSIVDATADAWFKIYAAVFFEKDEKRKVCPSKHPGVNFSAIVWQIIAMLLVSTPPPPHSLTLLSSPACRPRW